MRSKIKMTQLFYVFCWKLEDGNRRLSEPRFSERKFGFTLIELLLTVSLMAILAVAGGVSFINSYRQTTLKNTAEELVFEIRFAQQRAISQEEASQWGVRLDNTDAAKPFVDVFVSPYAPANIIHHYALPNIISFQAPTVGSYQEILFGKLTGLPSTSTQVIINIRGTNFTKTITINSAGGISTD